MVRWLEQNGYDVSYGTNVDIHDNTIGRVILPRHKAFLSVGHDEYWSLNMRNNMENARDRLLPNQTNPLHLGFFSANDAFWRIRIEPSAPPLNIPNRTITCYKGVANIDPLCPNPNDNTNDQCTVLWQYTPRPEYQLLGVEYQEGVWLTQDDVQDITITNPTHWTVRNISLDGPNNNLLKGLLGYEADRCYSPTINCLNPPMANPAGLQVIAQSPYDAYYIDKNSGQLLHSSGGTYHSHLTAYQARSGAWVFATGSIQWSWGLDSYGSGWYAPLRKVDNPLYVNTRNAAKAITARVLACFNGTGACQ